MRLSVYQFDILCQAKIWIKFVLSENILTKTKIETCFSWNEISEIHRVRNGIYQRRGRLISLLTDFGLINPCYPDSHGETKDTIFYSGAGRRGDQKLDSFNRAMLNAVETGHKVPLFNKLRVGRWEYLGFWRVTEGKYIFDKAQDRMIWQFTLQRVQQL
jgi:hypothetical protein